MSQGFYLGNELIAFAAKYAGASSAYAYPGTPSSEILSSFMEAAPDRYSQWAVNEKVALELSSAAAISGSYSFCTMKQVGLNVAADPLFSVAYTGVTGALVVVSADDPGPHSSQTEQDSRMYAYSAKIPVFDPATPTDAFELMQKAFEISHKYSIPVLIRPVMRVCHSRTTFTLPDGEKEPIKGLFKKDPERFAATPKYRAILHKKLIEKLEKIAKDEEIKIEPKNKFAIVASGYPYAAAHDIQELFKDKADLIKIDMPYPISKNTIEKIENSYEKILVLEETFPLVERAFKKREKVFGKDTGAVISAGEFTIDECARSISEFLDIKHIKSYIYEVSEVPPPAKPRLCAGCGHRPAFYAIKRAAPMGIYAGDIGCYTLGTNLNAVDTCICMGASITYAESLKRENPAKSVVCTIGDSTFFHTGIPALLNAKVNDAPITVAILDNATTAMTGFQPVPHAGGKVSIEKILEGLSIGYVVIADPYKLKNSIDEVKKAIKYAEENKTPAVIIFRKPCVTFEKVICGAVPEITEACTDCGICYDIFECPAISSVDSIVTIDKTTCNGCGVCIEVCPRNAIKRCE